MHRLNDNLNEENISLKEARNKVVVSLDAGIKCPCCRQHAQRYKRPLTVGMARALWAIYLAPDFLLKNNFLHVENFLKKLNCPASLRGDFPKLRFWDLISPKTEDREDGSVRNGFYKITQKGIDFVEGKICVPRHVFIYNNVPDGFSEEEITFEESKGSGKFNIQDIMITNNLNQQ